MPVKAANGQTPAELRGSSTTTETNGADAPAPAPTSTNISSTDSGAGISGERATGQEPVEEVTLEDLVSSLAHKTSISIYIFGAVLRCSYGMVVLITGLFCM